MPHSLLYDGGFQLDVQSPPVSPPPTICVPPALVVTKVQSTPLCLRRAGIFPPSPPFPPPPPLPPFPPCRDKNLHVQRISWVITFITTSIFRKTHSGTFCDWFRSPHSPHLPTMSVTVHLKNSTSPPTDRRKIQSMLGGYSSDQKSILVKEVLCLIASTVR
jgi:hypothetical protein